MVVCVHIMSPCTTQTTIWFPEEMSFHLFRFCCHASLWFAQLLQSDESNMVTFLQHMPAKWIAPLSTHVKMSTPHYTSSLHVEEIIPRIRHRDCTAVMSGAPGLMELFKTYFYAGYIGHTCQKWKPFTLKMQPECSEKGLHPKTCTLTTMWRRNGAKVFESPEKWGPSVVCYAMN